VLINDEEATLAELNMICGANHHLSSGNKIPKRRLPMQVNEIEGIAEQAKGTYAINKTREVVPDFGARSKILLHFMKGQISLTPMETVMKILGKLEYFERFIKLARKRKDEETSRNQVAIVNNTLAIKRIFVIKLIEVKLCTCPWRSIMG
jgi:hypothetical protein